VLRANRACITYALLSLAHTEADVDATIAAAREALAS
jgi:glutamate-1-semialdehyde aminotransferase